MNAKNRERGRLLSVIMGPDWPGPPPRTRELARFLGEDVGRLQRKLKMMERVGLVEERRGGWVVTDDGRELGQYWEGLTDRGAAPSVIC